MVPGTTFIKALRRVVFALVIGVGAASPAFAQDGSVVGRVIDAETHEPLISATIELRDVARSRVTRRVVWLAIVVCSPQLPFVFVTRDA